MNNHQSSQYLRLKMLNHLSRLHSYNPNSEVFTKWSRSDDSLALQNEKRIKDLIQEKNLRIIKEYGY